MIGQVLASSFFFFEFGQRHSSRFFTQSPSRDFSSWPGKGVPHKFQWPVVWTAVPVSSLPLRVQIPGAYPDLWERGPGCFLRLYLRSVLLRESVLVVVPPANEPLPSSRPLKFDW